MRSVRISSENDSPTGPASGSSDAPSVSEVAVATLLADISDTNASADSCPRKARRAVGSVGM